MLLLYINGSHKALSYCVCTGTSSPQSLKKILSLSEEAGERHRKQTEDSVSNNSSQLSSPPTSPHSSPKKGKDTLRHTMAFGIYLNVVFLQPLVFAHSI